MIIPLALDPSKRVCLQFEQISASGWGTAWKIVCQNNIYYIQFIFLTKEKKNNLQFHYVAFPCRRKIQAIGIYVWLSLGLPTVPALGDDQFRDHLIWLSLACQLDMVTLGRMVLYCTINNVKNYLLLIRICFNYFMRNNLLILTLEMC